MHTVAKNADPAPLVRGNPPGQPAGPGSTGTVPARWGRFGIGQWARSRLRDLRRRRVSDYWHQTLSVPLLKKYQRLFETPAGRRALAERAAIDAYAEATFGDRCWGPSLWVVAAARGGFPDGLVSQDWFWMSRVEAVSGSIQSRCRPLAALLFGTELVPDLVARVNGMWLRPGSGEVISEAELPAILFRFGDRVCVKRNDTGGGTGISFEDRDSFDPAAYATAPDLVIQRVISQPHWLEPLSPGGLATLRIMTAAPPGAPARSVFSFLRLARAGDGVVLAERDISVEVEDDGRLAERGFLPDYLCCDSHPDTGARFAGKAIPDFGALVATCLSLHERVRSIRLIGWDVGFDAENRPVLLEWNRSPGIALAQICRGTCLDGLGIHPCR